MRNLDEILSDIAMAYEQLNLARIPTLRQYWDDRIHELEQEKEKA